MSNNTDTQFSKIRSIFFPIHAHELQKLLPMLVILFLICFNYSILRPMKDTIIVSTSGAETIPFIKVWVLLPMAFLFTYIFTQLTSRYSQERVFYMLISSYLGYFLLFAFVIYPNYESFQLTSLAEWGSLYLPMGCGGLLSMLCHWSLTLFYVIAELWGSIVLTVLFWGIANDVTKIGEARRFYTVLTIGANIAAICAGVVANMFSQGKVYNPNIPFGSNGWEQTVMLLMLLITACGIISMVLFWWLNRKVLDKEEFAVIHTAGNGKFKTKKKRLSLRSSFRYLYKSNYLMCIAVIVIAYNLTINMVEIIWKNELRLLYPAHSDYNEFMNTLTMYMGIASTLTAVFMGQMIKRFGWTKTALITPVIMLITSGGFFSFLLLQDNLSGISMSLFAATPLQMVVFFGACQNCFSKAAKYSVFDATKEMAFIPLDHESKLRGKAAIDGVGSRFGKSGGSLIHQGLLLTFGTLGASSPAVASIITIVIFMWIYSTRTLGRQFHSLVSSQSSKEEKEDVAWA
ncbi:MAG: Npt1/Npt2 family nucleotide transporter [Waddliaceae bacterium]